MAFKKVQLNDTSLQLIQDNVDTALIPIQASPFVGGNLIKNISLISGQDNLIQHGLGRTPQVWFLGLPNVQSTIWSPTSASLSNSNVNISLINLRCSVSCIASLWVN